MSKILTPLWGKCDAVIIDAPVSSVSTAKVSFVYSVDKRWMRSWAIVRFVH